MSSYEDRPEEIIIEPKISDTVILIRGKDNGREAWHYILVPIDKLADCRAQPAGSNIDVTDYGEIMKYRNHQGRTESTSGWGRDPPKMLEIWLHEHYGQYLCLVKLK